jgi:membrane protein DedA with SNARE-associated domain
MFDSLVDLVASSDWPYAIVFAAAALDAVFPLVPSEATLVTAGALAASGRFSLAGVFLAGACGAFAGDNVGYAAGRLSARAVRHLPNSPRVEHRLRWAEGGLSRRAGTLIVVSRFVPGGRTVTMLAAGATSLRWLRFARLDALAGMLWAAYAVGLGVIGGMAFQDDPLYAVVLALGLAAALAILFEGGRRGPARWVRRNWRSGPRKLRM